MVDCAERYYVKRQAGISEYRKDGSRTDPETDRQAGEAERFAAEYFGAPFNDEIYSNRGDGGIDFHLTIGGETFSVDVVHLGLVNGRARRDGNLLINPHEPHRHAAIYVVVCGTIEEGFDIVGWYPHAELIKRSLRDFGYGLRYNCPVQELYCVDELC